VAREIFVPSIAACFYQDGTKTTLVRPGRQNYERQDSRALGSSIQRTSSIHQRPFARTTVKRAR
jgi:hypothetical protein